MSVKTVRHPHEVTWKVSHGNWTQHQKQLENRSTTMIHTLWTERINGWRVV